MLKDIVGHKKNMQRQINLYISKFAKNIEQPLCGHRDASWMAAPPWLSDYTSVKDICNQDEVECWKGDSISHRDIVASGVLTVKHVGVVGYRLNCGSDAQAIVNLADRWGMPLFFPFKKHWNLKSLIQEITLGPTVISRQNRRRAVLLGSSNVGFYHFLTEVVGDWWFLKKMGFNKDSFDLFIIHDGGKTWQKNILDLLDIEKDKIRSSFGFREKDIDLVIPYRGKGSPLNVPSWTCRALCEEIGVQESQKKGYRKVYISRKDATRRRMVNEAVLTGKLEKIGFEIVECENLNVREQQDLFGSAKIIVAGHGAALTNLVWCPENALVLDIHQESPAVPCFKILGEQSRIKYVPIFNAAEEIYRYGDWKISEKAVEMILDEVAVAP